MEKSQSLKRRDSSGSDASTSRIPVSYTPSLSRKQRPKLERHQSLQCLSSNSRGRSPKYDDDNESLRSGFSGCSNVSQCDHAHFARNGTTYSGRSKKFIVHCSPTHLDSDKYLTPTQRANATIKRLQSMLQESQADIAEKENEIARLTKELVELRLVKTEELSNGHSPGGGELRLTIDPVGRQTLETTSCSLADSGHFEELSLSPHPSPRNAPNGVQENVKRTQNLVHSTPETFNNSSRIDLLVHRLAEANDRYYEMKPQYEGLKKQLEELQQSKDEIEKKFTESEERHKSTYLQLFNKGQEAAIFQVDDMTDGPSKAENLPKLLKELEVTKSELESVKTMYRRLLESNKSKGEQEAEVTLKFLKSAFYYFLTDKENTTGHLAAIQSILGFTPDEKQAIEKASYGWK
ncbi:uncharacterized protein LOC106665076 isoform X2 [Cimex lectularius]|uniref:GRIP domain-containing protein n=1 Tax=Cimex lectularius TaxID=79782 RepID=A0A8I6TDH5_CIMLE|nr:uncharacterized protein LOC106665076 isoform X2 [Cimex lectularius]